MENNNEKYRDMERYLDVYWEQAENFKITLKEFKSAFIEDVGKYFIENLMTASKRKYAKKFMHEFRTNLYYNYEIEDFYENIVAWYLHYQNGNTHPFLTYELMKHYSPQEETPLQTYEEVYTSFIERLPPGNEKLARKFALESIRDEKEQLRQKKGWENKIKSFVMPLLIGNEMLTATAYREISLLSRLLIFTMKEMLYQLESDIEQNKIKDLDKMQEEWNKKEIENLENKKNTDIKDL